MAEEAQDIELMAPIGFDFCVHCLTVGETEKVAEVAPKVIDFLERTRRESESFGTLGFNPYTALVSSYGFSLAHLGNFEEAETQCQKALRFATVINDVSSMGYAECMYGMLLGIKGDGEKAVEHSQEAVKYLEETNIVTLLGTAWANLGWGYHLLGDPVTAVNHMKKGLEICSGLEGTPALSTGAYMNLGAVYLGSGDLDNARRCAEKVLELAQKWHMTWQELYAQAMLKGIAAVLDSSRFAEAEEYIVQLIKVADEHGWRVGCAEGYLNLGLLAAAVGQRDKAVEALDKAEGMFREMGMSFWLVSTQSVRKMLQV
jgi:tetratricopeptide (TPR) repeat protein